MNAVLEKGIIKMIKIIISLLFGMMAPAVLADTPKSPNILFIIMDDVGVDQMKSFGYGGVTPPAMTNIDQIAASGIRFRNTWSMPACTPSRAVFFEGRFPLRTHIRGGARSL
ncbi:MAG: hypothetical protein EPN17_13980 [Methylobacter sp.]|nr:MAG: hypothetical protein EPN17_13980 [Methylobacter sp.]